MATIKIKRTTGSSAPDNLALGELAYSEANNKLWIGDGSGVVEVKPEFLTYATDSVSDKISLDDGSGNTYTFDTSSLGGNVEYKFPTSTPDSTKALMSTTEGQLQYGEVSIGTLESVANVESDPQSNEVLVYNNGNWVGTDPATLKNELNIESSDSQTYTNLTLTGNLDVKGDSLQLNTSQLQIKDKSLGVGLSGDIITTTATIDSGKIIPVSTGSLANGDQVFVGDGNANIPTGFYTLNEGGFTITDSTATVSAPFDFTYSASENWAQVDGAGLVFPGDTEKSLKWHDTNDYFELVGGDLKITGNELEISGNKIIDSSSNTVEADINFDQITGSFDAGEYS